MYYPDNTYDWDGKQNIVTPPVWKPNAPFEAVMTLEGYSRGRSAANFDVVDENGVKYTIFMTDFVDLLQRHSVIAGKTEKLTWSFCKRGQNYGVRLHDET